MKRSINQRDLARAAGVCPATISLALRNHPSIPEPTRAHIRKLAEKMGYQANPRVAELMGQIRRNRATHHLTESIALYWSDADQATVHGYTHLHQMEEAIRVHLRSQGYHLICCYHGETDGTPARIERMLQARGIRGLLLAPLIQLPHRHLKWKWDSFSVVILGSGLWRPEFNRVRFNHAEEMGILLHHLHHRGFRRIGLVTDRLVDNRSQRAVSGGFFSRIPPALRAANPLFESDGEDRSAFLAWLKSFAPECLIVHSARVPGWLHGMRKAPPMVLTATNLGPAGQSIAGIHQDYNLLGKMGAEQLMGQLLLNRTGIPDVPVKVNITGTFQADTSFGHRPAKAS